MPSFPTSAKWNATFQVYYAPVALHTTVHEDAPPPPPPTATSAGNVPSSGTHGTHQQQHDETPTPTTSSAPHSPTDDGGRVETFRERLQSVAGLLNGTIYLPRQSSSTTYADALLPVSGGGGGGNCPFPPSTPQQHGQSSSEQATTAAGGGGQHPPSRPRTHHVVTSRRAKSGEWMKLTWRIGAYALVVAAVVLLWPVGIDADLATGPTLVNVTHPPPRSPGSQHHHPAENNSGHPNTTVVTIPGRPYRLRSGWLVGLQILYGLSAFPMGFLIFSFAIPAALPGLAVFALWFVTGAVLVPVACYLYVGDRNPADVASTLRFIPMAIDVSVVLVLFTGVSVYRQIMLNRVFLPGGVPELRDEILEDEKHDLRDAADAEGAALGDGGDGGLGAPLLGVGRAVAVEEEPDQSLNTITDAMPAINVTDAADAGSGDERHEGDRASANGSSEVVSDTERVTAENFGRELLRSQHASVTRLVTSTIASRGVTPQPRSRAGSVAAASAAGASRSRLWSVASNDPESTGVSRAQLSRDRANTLSVAASDWQNVEAPPESASTARLRLPSTGPSEDFLGVRQETTAAYDLLVRLPTEAQLHCGPVVLAASAGEWGGDGYDGTASLVIQTSGAAATASLPVTSQRPGSLYGNAAAAVLSPGSPAGTTTTSATTAPTSPSTAAAPKPTTASAAVQRGWALFDRASRNPLAVFGAVALVFACIIGAEIFCFWCAAFLFVPGSTDFTAIDHMFGDSPILIPIARYVFFTASMEALTVLAKLCGRFADALRTEAFLTHGHLVSSVVSLEWVADMTMTFFHAAYSRALFQRLESWLQFALVGALHLTLTFLAYPVRMTPLYFRRTAKLQPLIRHVPVVSLLYDGSNPAQWNTRLSLDYAVRLLAGVFESIAFTMFVIFLRFGYNRDFYTFFGSDMTTHDFLRVIQFLFVCLIVEVAGGVAVWAASRKLVYGGITTPFTLLVTREPHYQVFAALVLAHVTVEVFIAHLKL